MRQRGLPDQQRVCQEQAALPAATLSLPPRQAVPERRSAMLSDGPTGKAMLPLMRSALPDLQIELRPHIIVDFLSWTSTPSQQCQVQGSVGTM